MDTTQKPLVKTGSLDLDIAKSQTLVHHETTWLKNFTSKQTRKSYSITFREFCGYLAISNPEQFRAVQPSDMIAYRDSLIESGKSNRTVRNKLACISSCFKFLVKHQIVKNNPVEGIERPKVDETVGETPVMTNEQVKQLLSQPNIDTLIGARDSAILHFLAYTGSRIGSPRSITVKDFYEDKGFYVLKWTKKGGTKQVIPVAPALQSALLHYLDKSDHRNDDTAPLFKAVKRGNNNGAGLSNTQFTNIFYKYRDMASLSKSFTPHSLRATFATVCDENNVPIQDIQTALGHANISTTQSYIHSRKKYEHSAVFSVKY